MTTFGGIEERRQPDRACVTGLLDLKAGLQGLWCPRQLLAQWTRSAWREGRRGEGGEVTVAATAGAVTSEETDTHWPVCFPQSAPVPCPQWFLQNPVWGLTECWGYQRKQDKVPDPKTPTRWATQEERLCVYGARRDCVERTAVGRALKTGGWPGGWWVERGKNSGTRGREKGRGKSGVTECMLCVTPGSVEATGPSV